MKTLSSHAVSDTLTGWRDRLLTNDRFQYWAMRLPGLRMIARRRARSLFDLCAGFVYSQVLDACVRLDLLPVLAEGPQTATVVAERIALPVEGARRLLEAAVSLDLVERRRGGRFGLGMLGAAMLGNPAVLAMVRHHGLFYQDMRDPVALLRGEVGETALSRYWAYARSQAPDELAEPAVSDYSALMSASQALVADEILDAVPLGNARCLMDIGGGEGGFMAAVLGRYPKIRGIVFDLQSVADRAADRLDAAGFEPRVRVAGGDFRVDPLPTESDVMTLVRVVHDHDDDTVRALLAAAHRALPDSGLLIVAEPMADTPGAEPMGAAYFGFYLLAMGSGRPRSRATLTEMLREAGFADVRMAKTRNPLLTQVLVARKAAPASLAAAGAKVPQAAGDCK
ncbi:methyltransferase [Rhodospirillum rubrum]|uniref:methyltransferase n=1 Tax=Rhodospirillum rubrum TaxID=1085 RepID=UPI0019042220|nr:methyltransferase [Rhodospirillum rubrum]MBK1665786.1 methyltransferase [Rhodospirillum rubrum]MBK1677869.1 methyltransferase [Rhodospirillum rubrum]